MIRIKTNEQNSEYIDISRVDISILVLNNKIPLNILGKLRRLYNEMFEFEKVSGCGYLKSMSLKKDLEISQYLLNTNDIDIMNDDFFISYKKVVNAYNKAVYTQDNIKDLIYPLFMENVSGNYDELIKKYSKEVLDYILENPNFKKYLDETSPDYDPYLSKKEYVVYDEEGFSIKTLLPIKPFTKNIK